MRNKKADSRSRTVNKDSKTWSRRDPWDIRGVEDVQYQRQAQVTWWTVMGGIAVGALLTQFLAIVEEARIGHWQYLLYFLNSALIVSYSWILVVWGSLVLRHPLNIFSSLVFFFIGLSLSAMALEVTSPSLWMAALGAVAFFGMLIQHYWMRSGAWSSFSPEVVTRLKKAIWIYYGNIALTIVASFLLYRFPSMGMQVAWGVLVLILVVLQFIMQYRGMEQERRDLGIP